GAAGDARDDPAAVDAHRPLEDAADDALLPPDLAFPELTVGVEAGELGAGAGAAGRAVVGAPGAEDEVAAVGRDVGRRAEQLGGVDGAAVGPGDAVALQGAADAPGEVGQVLDVGQPQLLAVLGDEEEPVAAPGHVAGDGAEVLDTYRDVLGVAVAGD